MHFASQFNFSVNMEVQLLQVLTTLCSMLVTYVEGRWSNDLGGMLSRSCMYGFGITTVRSQYVGNEEDRLWEIKCSKIGLLRGDDVCMWTYDFENEAGKKLKYDCKENEYIAGLYSDYNTTERDRVWRIECCHSPGMTVSNCQESSDWANKYTENMNVTLEPKHVLQGVTSIYKQEKRDRKWKFTVCEVRKQSTANDNPVNPEDNPE